MQIKVKKRKERLTPGLYVATVGEVAPVKGDDTLVDVSFRVPDLDKPVVRRYSTEVETDSVDARELTEMAGRELEGINLEDLKGRKVIAYVVTKPAQGGRPSFVITAVFSANDIKEATEKLVPQLDAIT